VLSREEALPVGSSTTEGVGIANVRLHASATAAFDALYSRYRNDVFRLCAKWVRDRHRAEDLTQETFLRALRSFDTIDPSRGAWPWLATIARNLCIDELRSPVDRPTDADPLSTPREQAVSEDATWDQVLSRYKRDRLGGQLAEALRSLTPRQRRIVLMKTLENMTWAQIARREGSTQDTVRNLAFRARRVLRPLLAEARRELQSLGLLPVWLRVKGSFGRARDRVARRSAIRRPDLGLMLGEQFGAVLIGCIALTMTLAFPFGPSSHTEARSPERHLAAPGGARGVTPAPDAGGQGGDVPVGPGTGKIISAPGLDASIRTTPKNKHSVGPSSGMLVVEVMLPGTRRVLVRNEMHYRCGGQGADVIPQQGPVRAVC
jgi:RNA polymerase sigma-70 factor, ECF subfamily